MSNIIPFPMRQQRTEAPAQAGGLYDAEDLLWQLMPYCPDRTQAIEALKVWCVIELLGQRQASQLVSACHFGDNLARLKAAGFPVEGCQS